MTSIKGVHYPLVKTAHGSMATTENMSVIKSDMLCIILTAPGERVMEPFFGTALKKINYQASKESIIQQARQTIALALKRWEPRIQVSEITVNLQKKDQFTFILGVTIYFLHPKLLDQVQTLAIEIPVGRK